MQVPSMRSSQRSVQTLPSAAAGHSRRSLPLSLQRVGVSQACDRRLIDGPVRF